MATELFDAVIRRQIGIERAKSGEAKRAQKLLSKLDKSIIEALESLPDNFTNAQLNTVLSRINDKSYFFYKNELARLFGTTAKLAIDSELGFVKGLINKFFGKEEVTTPSKNDLFVIGSTTPYEGKTIFNWVQDLGADKFNRVSSAARNAVIDGGGRQDILVQVKQQIKIANRNADTIARTNVNQFVNVTRNEIYQFNSDVVDVLVWSSILDSRTTLTCAVRSNQKYDAETKDPIGHDNKWNGGPGNIHFNCRSIAIPIDDSGKIQSGPNEGKQYDEGTRTAIGGGSNYERGDNKKPDGSVLKFPSPRNNLEKQLVPADLTYDKWLRKQPREFVEDTLGVGKAKLFLDDKVSLQKFVVADGTELTLDQLK